MARAVFPKWFDRAAQIHDGLTRTTFLDIVGLSSLGERSWNQGGLSVKFGGFGLTQIQQVSNASFVAAWASSLKQLPNRFPALADIVKHLTETTRADGVIASHLLNAMTLLPPKGEDSKTHTNCNIVYL